MQARWHAHGPSLFLDIALMPCLLATLTAAAILPPGGALLLNPWCGGAPPGRSAWGAGADDFALPMRIIKVSRVGAGVALGLACCPARFLCVTLQASLLTAHAFAAVLSTTGALLGHPRRGLNRVIGRRSLSLSSRPQRFATPVVPIVIDGVGPWRAPWPACGPERRLLIALVAGGLAALLIETAGIPRYASLLFLDLPLAAPTLATRTLWAEEAVLIAGQISNVSTPIVVLLPDVFRALPWPKSWLRSRGAGRLRAGIVQPC